MANYEDSSAVIGVIDDAVANGELSKETADAITKIVDELNADGQFTADSVAHVTENVTQENLAQTVGDAAVVLMGATASADVKFDDSSNVQAMVVGGGGNSNVVFETSKDVSVQLQGGTNDSVATGSGNDAVTFAGGTATIDTGEGDDMVILQGGENGGEATVKGGTGNMNINIDFDLGTTNVKASIDAGEGFDAVSVGGGRAGHFIQFIDNVFRMVKHELTGQDDGIMTLADEGGSVDMTNVNVVKFTGEGGKIDDITILADTAGEATVGRIYQFALGRQAIDVVNGQTELDSSLDYWFETYGASKDMDPAQIEQMAYDMVGSSEFAEKYGAMSPQEFADQMFANVNAVSSVTVTSIGGRTAAEYAQAIANHSMSMEDVAVEIANSQEAIDAMNGSQYMVTMTGIA